MANTDRPHGFAPYGPLCRNRPYDVDGSDGTAIFSNDVVEAQDDGYVNQASAGDLATIGSSMSYLAASTAGTIMVADSRDQLFEAQDDASGTLAQTSIFNNCDMIAGVGSAYTLISGHEIAASTLSAGDRTFMLLDLVPRSDNAHGDNGDYVCTINTGEGIFHLQAGV